MILDDYEKKELAAFIEKRTVDLNEHQPKRFLIEVIPGQMSTNVKISNIVDTNLHIQVTDTTSLIDWENYDF